MKIIALSAGLFMDCITFDTVINRISMNSINAFAFRLKPGQDLKVEIQNFVVKNNIKAGWIGTCVGSLTKYNMRFANQSVADSLEGYFEILNLSGTVSVNGLHLHICVSDDLGKTKGGHLMDGCIIYTTAEIVIMSSDDFEFNRKEDELTKWKELQIIETKSK